MRIWQIFWRQRAQSSHLHGDSPSENTSLFSFVATLIVEFTLVDESEVEEQKEQVLWDDGKESNHGMTLHNKYEHNPGKVICSLQTESNHAILCRDDTTIPCSITILNCVWSQWTCWSSERTANNFEEVIVTSSGCHFQSACKEASTYHIIQQQF